MRVRMTTRRWMFAVVAVAVVLAVRAELLRERERLIAAEIRQMAQALNSNCTRYGVYGGCRVSLPRD